MQQRGDTIIEVVLAVTIFSMVVMGAMTLMNRGIAMAQRSLEVTLVRQQIDSQAELLRFVHERAQADKSGLYATNVWDPIPRVSNPQELIDADTCPTSISGGFVFVPSAGPTQVVTSSLYNGSPATYAKVESGQAEGLSIQLMRVAAHSGGGYDAYDAYIQACWQSPGLSRPMTIGTIVRLYDADAV